MPAYRFGHPRVAAEAATLDQPEGTAGNFFLPVVR